jgi:hypothetical protein
MNAGDVLRSAALWFFIWSAAIVLFLMYGARPLLRLLGGLFQLMGGPGLEGIDL